MTTKKRNASKDITPLILRRFTRKIRTFLSTRPALYIPLRRLRRADSVVTKETELLLEGFPRCGNTWAEMAIRHASQRAIRMAHHSHAAAHVIYAQRYRIPTLIIYREPDAAVKSLLAMKARNMAPEDAYGEYVAFYRAVLSLPREDIIFFSFEDVTQRIGTVLDRLNKRFGFDFSVFDSENEIEKSAVFALMDARAKKIRSDGKAVSRSNPAHYGAEQID